jgi:hypothetical protein
MGNDKFSYTTEEDQEQFATLVAWALRKQGENRRIEFHPESFKLVIEAEHEIFLGNFYHAFENASAADQPAV